MLSRPEVETESSGRDAAHESDHRRHGNVPYEMTTWDEQCDMTAESWHSRTRIDAHC
jgi:hypothetical protein